MLTALTLGKRFEQTRRAQTDRKTSARWRRLWIFDSRCDGPENAASFCQLVLIYGAFRGQAYGLAYSPNWSEVCLPSGTLWLLWAKDFWTVWSNKIIISWCRQGWSITFFTVPTLKIQLEPQTPNVKENSQNWTESVHKQNKADINVKQIQQLVKTKLFILPSDSKEAGINPRLLLPNAGTVRKDFRRRGV